MGSCSGRHRHGVYSVHLRNDREPEGGCAHLCEYVRQYEGGSGGKILFRRNKGADNAAVSPHFAAYGNSCNAAARRGKTGFSKIDITCRHCGSAAKISGRYDNKRAEILRAAALQHNVKDKPFGCVEGIVFAGEGRKQPQIFRKAVFCNT